MTNGIFNLFVEDGSPGHRQMRYRLEFADGERASAACSADTRTSFINPGFEMWSETTTLYTTVLERPGVADDEPASMRAGAASSTSTPDFARQLTTFRVTPLGVGRFGRSSWRGSSTHYPGPLAGAPVTRRNGEREVIVHRGRRTALQRDQRARRRGRRARARSSSSTVPACAPTSSARRAGATWSTCSSTAAGTCGSRTGARPSTSRTTTGPSTRRPSTTIRTPCDTVCDRPAPHESRPSSTARARRAS